MDRVRRFGWLAVVLGCAITGAPSLLHADSDFPAPLVLRADEAAAPAAQPPVEPPAPLTTNWLERPQLGGDLWGLRPALASDGITFTGSTTQYYQGDVTGGKQQAFEYGGRGDYFLNVNGEKAGLWKGFMIDMHGETRYGESANSLTGGLSPPNLMLAVPKPNGQVTALTAVKFSQFLSENSLVYAGKLNLLDGFRQPITGATGLDGFMNGSLMFNLIYARTVPYSTYGAGYAYLKDLQPVASMTVLDTNNIPTSSGFNNFFSNGAVLLWQVNLPTKLFDMPGHQGLSGTYSSGKYTDLQPTAFFNPGQGLTIVSTQQTGSYSFAYNFDQALWVSQDDPKRMWGVFGNLGIADNNPSPIRYFANVGISGSSPFRSRKLDSFGVGYAYIGLSSALKDAFPRLLPLQDEQVVELYYNIGVTPWCHITPDLQVLSPALQTANTALLLGLRAKIDF